MPEFTPPAADNLERPDCWHVYYGDAHAGTIAKSAGIPWDKKMYRSIKLSLVLIFVALLVNAASAQTPRNVATKKNTPVALTSLLNTKPDCTGGPIDIPVVKQPPAHGAVQLQLGVVDVPHLGACPARKAAVIALLYAPGTDFVGEDILQVEVGLAGKVTNLRYQITVQDEQ